MVLLLPCICQQDYISPVSADFCFIMTLTVKFVFQWAGSGRQEGTSLTEDTVSVRPIGFSSDLSFHLYGKWTGPLVYALYPMLYTPKFQFSTNCVVYKNALIIFTKNDILPSVILWCTHTVSIKSVNPTGSQNAWWPLVSFEMQTLSCCLL